MASSYYEPCPELDACNALGKYWEAQEYGKWFAGHLPLAEQGYPLAECQVGYCYLKALGVERDLEKAFEWTRRAAEHGDWDGQYNLGCFYEDGVGTAPDLGLAIHWYREAARQGHDLAIQKCKGLQISL